MNTIVDVLAVMEQAACALRIDARHEQAEDMEIARTAVAELLEAADALLTDNRLKSLRDFQAALARVRGEQ